MKRQLSGSVAAAFLSILAWSCNQSDPAPKGDYVQGVFVMNEGNFSQNNGGISYFAREQNTAEAEIFSGVNGGALGGGVQDYTAFEGKGIILIDNMAAGMDKVQFVDSHTFKAEGSIGAPDIENPREVVIAGKKAYVTCWGINGDYNYNTGYVAVIDMATKKVTKKLDVAKGPENLVIHNGKIFVGTTTFSVGKTMTVISTANDEIVKSIQMSGTVTPIGADANGKLWVNAGISALKMNPDSYTVEATLPIGTDASKIPNNFTFSSDLKSIFFVLTWYDANYAPHGDTYKFAISDSQVNVNTPLIKRNFTGLSVDPVQGLLYAGVTPSLAQAGYAVRYRTDGSLVDSVKVGVSPTGFFFK